MLKMVDFFPPGIRNESSAMLAIFTTVLEQTWYWCCDYVSVTRCHTMTPTILLLILVDVFSLDLVVAVDFFSLSCFFSFSWWSSSSSFYHLFQWYSFTCYMFYFLQKYNIFIFVDLWSWSIYYDIIIRYGFLYVISPITDVISSPLLLNV